MAYRKGLQLSLGSIVTTQVDLQTVIPARKSGLRMLCPEHHIPLKQGYTCFNEGEGHPVERDQAVKGLQVPEGWRVVDPEAKPEVPRVDALQLTPVPVKELEAQTTDGQSIYYCEPSNAVNLEAWTVFERILSKGKIALVTKGALRANSEKMWRLDTFRDYLVLREITFPDDIKDAPEKVNVKVDKEIQSLVDQFIAKLQIGWDEFDSTDQNRQRVQEWLDAGRLVEGEHDIEAIDTMPKVVDLKAALQGAVG